jgi:hypothetical protein
MFEVRHGEIQKDIKKKVFIILSSNSDLSYIVEVDISVTVFWVFKCDFSYNPSEKTVAPRCDELPQPDLVRGRRC